MKEKIVSTLHWLRQRPIAIINLLGLLIIVIGGSIVFLYLLNKPIDVLADWTVTTAKKEVNGQLPTYNPGGTLEFISTSVKLVSAEGITTRTFDCDATQNQAAREITLTPALANRVPGYNPPKENSLVVPSVNQFNGLPRTCRIVFNICYNDVILWRDHCETARTNDFLVEEQQLNPESIRKQIDDLNERIKQLESQLLAVGETPANTAPQASAPVAQTPQSTAPSSDNGPVAAAPEPSAPSDDRRALGRLPLVGGLLDSLGL